VWRARGLPGNVGHESDPFGAHLAELSRRNAEAIYRGATGEDLDSDTTISAGHKHDAGADRIDWHQLGSWQLEEDFDDDNREGAMVTATAATDLLLAPIRWPHAQGGPTQTRLRTRVRVTNPASGYATYTTLYLAAAWYREGAQLTTAAVPLTPWAMAIQSTAARTYVNEWIQGPDVRFTSTELSSASGNLWLLLSAYITTAGDKATLHELQGAWL
jgi:hypothetical protein